MNVLPLNWIEFTETIFLLCSSVCTQNQLICHSFSFAHFWIECRVYNGARSVYGFIAKRQTFTDTQKVNKLKQRTKRRFLLYILLFLNRFAFLPTWFVVAAGYWLHSSPGLLYTNTFKRNNSYLITYPYGVHVRRLYVPLVVWLKCHIVIVENKVRVHRSLFVDPIQRQCCCKEQFFSFKTNQRTNARTSQPIGPSRNEIIKEESEPSNEHRHIAYNLVLRKPFQHRTKIEKLWILSFCLMFVPSSFSHCLRTWSECSVSCYFNDRLEGKKNNKKI